MPTPKLSILISARKNSKYLAKFLHGLEYRTLNWPNLESKSSVEVLVMLNEHDTWNDELAALYTFESGRQIRFIRENYGLGRAGLHRYFNELYKQASGDWIIYFCEDHFITKFGWDEDLFSFIRQHDLDPAEPWCIVPKFDNVGAMNHILSRGYCQAMGGRLGRHGWIDSYINALNVGIEDRVLRVDDEWFHDFSHDKPSPMSDAHMSSPISVKGRALPSFEHELTKKRIAEDQAKLKRKLGRS